VEGAPLNFLDGADICVIIVFSIDITLNFLTGCVSPLSSRVLGGPGQRLAGPLGLMAVLRNGWWLRGGWVGKATGRDRFIDTKEHRVIMHWRPVAIEYLKFWFLIDLVSTLPPEVWANNGQVTRP
jgi:hypothetical protein